MKVRCIDNAGKGGPLALGYTVTGEKGDMYRLAYFSGEYWKRRFKVVPEEPLSLEARIARLEAWIGLGAL